MTKEEERELREQLARLQQEHRDLDAAIIGLAGNAGVRPAPGGNASRSASSTCAIAFPHIEDELTPDIIA